MLGCISLGFGSAEWSVSVITCMIILGMTAKTELMVFKFGTYREFQEIPEVKFLNFKDGLTQGLVGLQKPNILLFEYRATVTIGCQKLNSYYNS